VIASALSVALVLAVAGEPPGPPAPDAAPPAVEAPKATPSAEEAPAPSAASPPGSGQFVAVVRPVVDDPLLREASSRIGSELAAGGLRSRLLDCAEPTEAPCPGPDAVAAIALGRKEGVVEIDVRAFLPDGFELSRHVRVADRDGGRDPSVLAVRAVELLRDLRLNAQRRAPPGPPRPAVDGEEPKIPLPPPPPPPRWWLSAGVGTLAAPRTNQPGIWPALGVTLAAGTVLAPRWDAVLTLAGPFNSKFGTIDNGEATLLQALATVELRFKFAPRAVQPFVAVLTGINYLRETLYSLSPTQRQTVTSPLSTAWVPLFGAGAGLSYNFGQRLSVDVEAEIFATAPYILVEVYDGQVVARAGLPSIFLTADLSLLLP
jgi:hypothetical protein